MTISRDDRLRTLLVGPSRSTCAFCGAHERTLRIDLIIRNPQSPDHRGPGKVVASKTKMACDSCALQLANYYHDMHQ